MNSNSTKSLDTASEKKTITANDYLKKRQRRWALLFVLVPFLGSVLAIILLWQWGISAIEIVLLVTMYALSLVGITVGFHRHFSHCAFRTNTAVRVILAILGSMTAQGPVIHWVCNHRYHHQHADQMEDLHSPHVYEGVRGLWHSHVGWMFNSEVISSVVFAKDLLQDPVIIKVNQLYPIWVILGLAIPSFLDGVVTETWIGAWQGLLWGGLVRIFLAHNITWSINSITHVCGRRPFDNRDLSTNNLWLAIPTFGEAWHNNHHAFPSSGKMGLKWWQVDLGYWVIRAFEFAGLVWNVKTPTAEMIKAKSCL